MSVTKFLLLSSLTLALVAATLVRAEQPGVDSKVTGANCCEPACGAPPCSAPHCCAPPCCPNKCCGPDCCDEKYHSECCGEGCLLKNVRLHDCCGKVCMSKVEEVTEEKSCWKVECEEICVPRVVCPWAEGGSGLTIFNFMKKRHHHTGCASCGDTCCDSCCDNCCNGCCGDCGCSQTPRCGDVRCVRVLASEDYECTKCQCKWDIKEGCYRYGAGCCGRSCRESAGCGCGVECGDDCGCAPMNMTPPAPAPVEVPPPPTSAVRSSNGKYRVTIAQAFGIKQTNCEEPVTSKLEPEKVEEKPAKSSWSMWK